jgi:hypothetical protein
LCANGDEYHNTDPANRVPPTRSASGRH